ncbi:MAG: single-stranded DNA-binding protein [Micrococcales bacterium]|nr:single-stranded DNA-binding protein [Micrococcales bacterium]
MNDTYVTIAGNAVEDPVRRTTSNGDPFVHFRLASTPRRRVQATGEYADGDTNFVDVHAFRGLARNAAASIAKGQPLVVHGLLRVREWASGDSRGTNVEIEAIHIGHDLRWGSAVFTKTAHDAAPPTTPSCEPPGSWSQAQPQTSPQPSEVFARAG